MMAKLWRLELSIFNIAIATDGFVDVDSSVALFLILTNSPNRVSHKKTTKFFVSPSAHLSVSHRRSEIPLHRPSELTQEWEIFLMKFSCSPIMVTSSEHGWRLRDKLHSAFVCCILTASTSPFGAGSNLHIMARGRYMHRDVLLWWFRLHAFAREKSEAQRKGMWRRNNIDGRAECYHFYHAMQTRLRLGRLKWTAWCAHWRFSPPPFGSLAFVISAKWSEAGASTPK